MTKVKLGVHNEWVPNSVYHRGPGASNSDLATLYFKSPAHLKWRKDHVEPGTEAMNLGSLFHTLVLEPEHMTRRFHIFEGEKRSKVKKEEWAKAEGSGKIVVREKATADVVEMVKSVKAHPAAGAFLERMDGTIYERPIYWKEETTGLLCKVKPDIIIHNTQLRILVDLKKTRDASYKGFQKAIGTYLYDMQAAYYLDGAKAGTGKDFDAFCFICCEPEPPYAVSVYLADAEMIEKGRELYKHNLGIFKKCLNTGEWPGYPKDVQTISLPMWRL